MMLMYSLSAQNADATMCRAEGGVELALQYAKMWCRYAKDLLTWIDKRITLGESGLLFFLYSVDTISFTLHRCTRSLSSTLTFISRHLTLLSERSLLCIPLLHFTEGIKHTALLLLISCKHDGVLFNTEDEMKLKRI